MGGLRRRRRSTKATATTMGHARVGADLYADSIAIISMEVVRLGVKETPTPDGKSVNYTILRTAGRAAAPWGSSRPTPSPRPLSQRARS